MVKRKRKISKTQSSDASKTLRTSNKSVKHASDEASAVNKRTKSARTTTKRR